MRPIIALTLLCGCSRILGFEEPHRRDAGGVSVFDVPMPDTSLDVLIDTPDDAPRDASIDAPRDAAPDAPRDAAPDARPDAPTDAAIDAPRDAAIDAPPDAPPDARIDAPIDSCNAVRFPGATAFNVDPATSHCYVGYAGANLDWNASQAKCVSIGGYLPTISSAAENTLVDSTSAAGDGSMWIGATVGASGFAWVTGEPFSYTNYIVNEPSGDGNCLHIAGLQDKWNDITCFYTGMATTVCEVP